MFEIGDEVIIIPPDNCQDPFIKYMGSIVTIVSEESVSGCYDVVFHDGKMENFWGSWLHKKKKG